jgi:uncharacterized protein (TIGR02391 family)
MPDNVNDNVLTMTFTPNTIEHLGVRLYSTLPPVVSELVANAYDADASLVQVVLDDSDETCKTITVIDDGHGMTFAEINSKFLRIGRNRRNSEGSQVSVGGRPVIGKKGLGKLSFFGIANEIIVKTVKEGLRNEFILRWQDIINIDEDHDLSNYNPEIRVCDQPTDENHGTTIALHGIKRASAFDIESLAGSLSKIFIIEPGFQVELVHGNQSIVLDNERKYSLLNREFEWSIPHDIELPPEVELYENVSGLIITTDKPIPPSLLARGITLYSRKKLVNLPEYYSDSDSSHFYSYVAGWLEVDFIDDLDEDVIETNRQSLDWQHPEMVKLRECIKEIVRVVRTEWRERRAERQRQKVTTDTGIDIQEWQNRIPDEIKTNLNPIIDALKGDAEKPEEDTASVRGIQNLYELLPPYPYFHWRKLHKKLGEVVFEYYAQQNYYTAVLEGVKHYVHYVKRKSASLYEEKALLENVFKLINPVLSVTDAYRRPDGTDFRDDTHRNIKEGHRFLALAIWEAFRNPLAHEEVSDLRESGLFTEKDCLDALSLLSHLFRRLDNARVLEGS